MKKLIKKVLNNKLQVKLFHQYPSKCIICLTPRQKQKYGIKIKYTSIKTVSYDISFKLLKFYNILVGPKRYICTICYKNLFEILNNGYLNNLKVWNTLIWSVNKDGKKYVNKDSKVLIYKFKNICNTLLISKKLNSYSIKNSYLNILESMIKDILNNTITLSLNNKYKYYTGLKREQLKMVFLSILNIINMDNNNNDPNYSKSYILNQTGGPKRYKFYIKNKKIILKDIIILLIKWKLTLPNVTIASLFETGKMNVRHSIYRGTVLIFEYSKIHLINTKYKLKKERPNKDLRRVMNINENVDVCHADGVRFKCQSATHFQTQQFNYDNKHKYNAYNCIGFNTLKNGKYIGFYPVAGVGSDGHHWDGHVMDFNIFNNIDGILNWLTINSKPYISDGTRIIFDRALFAGCVTFSEGVVTYSTPIKKNTSKKTAYENNKSRCDATISRWSIEKSFGNLGNVWPIFSSQSITINNCYVPVFGKWLNGAAGICNHIGIGLVDMSETRKKQIKLMDLKKNQDIYDQFNNNEYSFILKTIESNESLKKYWIKAKSVQHLIKTSPYWTSIDKLKHHFYFKKTELINIGGGIYTYRLGKWYMVHSKYFIEVWFSKLKDYQKYLLIRNIKPRMTRNWDKNHSIIRGSNKRLHTTDDLEYIEYGDIWKSKFHNVLIGKRRLNNRIIDVSKYNFSNKELNTFFCCSCIHGSRTICADSHVICALRYLQIFIDGGQIKDDSYSKSKWDDVIDINYFKAYLKDLKKEYLQIYINKFMNNKNIKPLFT